jgi:hypothetical protein
MHPPPVHGVLEHHALDPVLLLEVEIQRARVPSEEGVRHRRYDLRGLRRCFGRTELLSQPRQRGRLSLCLFARSDVRQQAHDFAHPPVRAAEGEAPVFNPAIRSVLAQNPVLRGHGIPPAIA